MQSLVAAAEQPGAAYQVAIIASDKPDAAGLRWAAEQGIATFALSPKGIGKAAYEAAVDTALREAGVEIIALAGYMRCCRAISSAGGAGGSSTSIRRCCRLQGLDTHARAIAAGDAEAGCSVHIVTEELDDGDVLGRRACRSCPVTTPTPLRRGCWSRSIACIRRS